MTHLESGVPERVEHRFDERLELRGGGLREDEQVEVAFREQGAAAPAAKRDDRPAAVVKR
jgi:hypothetical protein